MSSTEKCKPWPRLSESLGCPRAFNTCQGCGQVATDTWEECDRFDRPEGIFLRLCRRCSDVLIEPHPRLYVSKAIGEPAPGVMLCCEGCKHCENLRCTSPQAKRNGGPGFAILVNQVGWACSRGKGGGCRPLYDSPPQCEGRESCEWATGERAR